MIAPYWHIYSVYTRAITLSTSIPCNVAWLPLEGSTYVPFALIQFNLCIIPNSFLLTASNVGTGLCNSALGARITSHLAHWAVLVLALYWYTVKSVPHSIYMASSTIHMCSSLYNDWRYYTVSCIMYVCDYWQSLLYYIVYLRVVVAKVCNIRCILVY